MTVLKKGDNVCLLKTIRSPYGNEYDIKRGSIGKLHYITTEYCGKLLEKAIGFVQFHGRDTNKVVLLEELGLYKWLRTIVPANISIHEDLLESLFGGLFNIGDRVLGGGNGYVLCRNLAANIYDIEGNKLNFLKDATILVINDIKILLIGVTASSPSYNEFYKLTNMITRIQLKKFIVFFLTIRTMNLTL